ncbi:flavodoxin [Candidatus Saccharibacteria bacterium]|nr:flavodoxin [Candidatus Saccharibacteria bacterium]
MSKTLVIYFSHEGENYNVGTVEVGNTELLAKEIVAKTSADEFKIVPENNYPGTYQETIEVASAEQKSSARPKYIGDVDITNYDTIFFGYPIWWEDLPMVVYSFIEKHNFSGKVVMPFNTHEGSGNAGTNETLKSLMPGAILKGDGFNMTGSIARTEEGIKKINNWLDGLREFIV